MTIFNGSVYGCLRERSERAKPTVVPKDGQCVTSLGLLEMMVSRPRCTSHALQSQSSWNLIVCSVAQQRITSWWYQLSVDELLRFPILISIFDYIFFNLRAVFLCFSPFLP